MKKKIGCLISGGGAWGAYGGGTLARINKNYDTVVGVSTGSLLAPLTALREWEYLKTAYLSSNNYNFYDNCWYKGEPLTKKGKVRVLPIIMALLLGQKSIYTTHNLRKRIDEFFLESHFNELKKQKKEIIVGTHNFAEVPSKNHYFSSLNENFEDFKDWIWCSANLPLFSSLIKKCWHDGNGNFHVGSWGDGGLIDLVGFEQINPNKYSEIDIILHRTKNNKSFEGNKIHNLTENVMATINAMLYKSEFQTFYEKIKHLNNNGTKVTVYWLPRKPSPNIMVFNEKEMSEWWSEGYETAYDSNRVETFEPIKKRF